MTVNSNLHSAKRGKNDEFYTQLSDIENEMRHYWPHFRDKVVYCNCDDPGNSNFHGYFHDNFRSLGIREIVSSCYRGRKPSLLDADTQPERGLAMRYDGMTCESYRLQGSGDFRSAECIDLLKHSDIIVTNPPFSLFREYIAQLMEYGKKFLILGNMNGVHYRDIFPLFMGNQIWLGINNGGTKWFEVDTDYTMNTPTREKTVDGRKYFSLGNTAWFTNLDHPKRHENIPLNCRYSPERYPRYDNHHAIDVDRYHDIPVDYDGEMGVPNTFMHRYNPDQFEITGFRKGLDGRDLRIDGKEKFIRILIRHRKTRRTCSP